MPRRSGLVNLYLLNSALLFTHEIDSAFWKEWDLFGIPGGIQMFLALNFLLLLVVLFGFKQVVLGTASAAAFSLLVAAGGIFAFLIHNYFLWRGHPEFDLPVSKLLLWATLVCSVVQAVATVRGGRRW